MPRKRVIESDRIALSSRDITTWPMVNTDALDLSDRETFLQRKQAVDLYMQNEISIKEITKRIPIERSVLRRLVKRCLSLDDEGNIWGYRALIPHRNLKSYERKMVGTSSNMAG